MGSGYEEVNFLQRQAKGMALFSAFCLTLALVFYAAYACRLHDRPGDQALLGLVVVPMIQATTSLTKALLLFCKARRAARTGGPES